jgi:hypothetical protein
MLAAQMRERLRARSDVARDPVAGEEQSARGVRTWHVDDDAVRLVHRASVHDAERARDILDIATEIARRQTRGPWSVPHLVSRAGGATIEESRDWSGGADRATFDDSMPSYLVVDALLMRGAVAMPQMADKLRRAVIRDAREPTGAEIALANQTSAILQRYKGAVMANTRTVRDIEMGSDALMLHNASARRREGARSTSRMTRDHSDPTGTIVDLIQADVANPMARRIEYAPGRATQSVGRANHADYAEQSAIARGGGGDESARAHMRGDLAETLADHVERDVAQHAATRARSHPTSVFQTADMPESVEY